MHICKYMYVLHKLGHAVNYTVETCLEETISIGIYVHKNEIRFPFPVKWRARSACSLAVNGLRIFDRPKKMVSAYEFTWYVDARATKVFSERAAIDGAGAGTRRAHHQPVGHRRSHMAPERIGGLHKKVLPGSSAVFVDGHVVAEPRIGHVVGDHSDGHVDVQVEAVGQRAEQQHFDALHHCDDVVFSVNVFRVCSFAW